MRTPVKNVPPARAWSPAPSASGFALRSSSPEMICTWSRTLASGCKVGGSAKLPPASSSGHHPAGMIPFGTYRNAIFTGALATAPAAAPPVSASARMAPSESNAGSAMHAPSPRRNRRRLKLANRSAAALEFFGMDVFIVFLDFWPTVWRRLRQKAQSSRRRWRWLVCVLPGMARTQ